MKRLINLMLCLALLFSLAVPGFAEEGEGSVTPSESQEAPPASSETQAPACSHSWNEGSITTAPGCVTEGVKTLTCTLCGATSTTSVPATGAHTPGAWQRVDGEQHKRVCTGCGGAEETAAHSWDGGSVTTPATCTTAGVKTYSCACGATKTEEIAVNTAAHSFGEWEGDEGTHSRTCSGCGHVESGAHSWHSSTVTVAPTCQEEGIEAIVCTTCSGMLYEILPKIDHAYDDPCDPDCNMCGLTRDVEHKYNKTWSRDSSQHWHTCSLCGDKTDVGGHFPGPAATEEKAQLCLTCGLTMTPKLNHTHKYETTWTTDEDSHWYACSGCEERKDLQEHVFDDVCDPDCNICGYKTDKSHSYTGDWNTNEEGHWNICTRCGETSEAEEHIPGPEATDTEPQVCTVCGFELAPPQVHVHEYEEVWHHDEEHHWLECQCGEKTEPEEHTWDEGEENGETVTFTCEACGAERTEQIPEKEFPWWILIVGILFLIGAGAAVCLILILRKPKSAGKYGR